jgi:hypothetical protein
MTESWINELALNLTPVVGVVFVVVAAAYF